MKTACLKFSSMAHVHHVMLQAHSQTGGEAQEWVRAMLGTVGRGGNAQAVRDEILHIMHRNKIGEKRGTWMEVRASLLCPTHAS